MLLIKILLIIGLIKLLMVTNKPFMCAGIYGVAVFIFGLAFGITINHLLISTTIGFALAAGYFWLLDYMDGMEIFWWVVTAIGLMIVLI